MVRRTESTPASAPAGCSVFSFQIKFAVERQNDVRERACSWSWRLRRKRQSVRNTTRRTRNSILRSVKRSMQLTLRRNLEAYTERERTDTLTDRNSNNDAVVGNGDWLMTVGWSVQRLDAKLSKRQRMGQFRRRLTFAKSRDPYAALTI